MRERREGQRDREPDVDLELVTLRSEPEHQGSDAPPMEPPGAQINFIF